MIDARPCPACGQLNTARRIICKHCGINLQDAARSAAAAVADSQNPNLIDCPDCGRRVMLVASIREGGSAPSARPVVAPSHTYTEGPTATGTLMPSPTLTPPPRTATAAARMTATADAIAAVTATAEAIERDSPWSYSDSPDSMGRGTAHFAQTVSSTPLEFGFPYEGTQYPMLTLRRSPRYGIDVYVSIDKGQFLCDSYDGCFVNVRFGNGPVHRFGAAEPDDHSTTTLFIRSAPNFIAATKKVATVSIEAKFFQEGNRVMTFDTRYLKWK